MRAQESEILDCLMGLRPSTPKSIQLEVFAHLRQYWRDTGGSERVAEAVSARLGIARDAFYLALNHPEVMTKGIVDAGAFGDKIERLYKTIARRKQVAHQVLMRLFSKEIGGAKGLADAIEVLIQHHLIRKEARCPPGKEHTKVQGIWYILVEYGLKPDPPKRRGGRRKAVPFMGDRP